MDLSNSSVNIALMFTIACQNHACNRETISHFKFQILFAMMKKSGTTPSPPQKQERRTQCEVDMGKKKARSKIRKFIAPPGDCRSEGALGKGEIFLYLPLNAE